MITLATNQQNQTFYVTPFQRKKDFPGLTFRSYLMEIQSLQTEKKHHAIFFQGAGTLQQDNERYTELVINTHAFRPDQASVYITESGQYSYKIYAQNSVSNTDPTDSSVWGELERGLMTFRGEAAWSMPNINIPDNVVYYE